ncbi:MAG: acetate kinase [Deltaproteobacteria bacterium]|nr:acetate kinase [Deltaproteobacteria bacterium]
MNILIINAGSSSVKFTCFQLPGDKVLARGLVERIGLSGTMMKCANHRGEESTHEVQVSNTVGAVGQIAAYLTDEKHGVIKATSEIDAIGHRLVHGGEWIKDTVLIDDEVKKTIEKCFELAPLHNPPNLDGVLACEEHFPGKPQVGVFDTAFHSSIPEHAFLYGLPYQLYKEDKIRRYGFHGTSHKYVSFKAAEFLGRPVTELKLITCHLGNGCSITAVDKGRSLDTSMGLTPLEGLIMGTRCGDLDPAIVFYLMEHKKLDRNEIDNLLNKRSGLLGLAGINSSDLRDVLKARDEGNAQAAAAIKAFCYRIKKYIGAYTASLGSLDALIFTGGIGENSPDVREMVCENMASLGLGLDVAKNKVRSNGCREIHDSRSGVKILVVPTNEELEIAMQTYSVWKAQCQPSCCCSA